MRIPIFADFKQMGTSPEGLPIGDGCVYPATVIVGPGGDRTGAVLLSPFIKSGTVSAVPYNHYSMLKSLETIFGITEFLGYANQPGLVTFGSDIFTKQ